MGINTACVWRRCRINVNARIHTEPDTARKVREQQQRTCVRRMNACKDAAMLCATGHLSSMGVLSTHHECIQHTTWLARPQTT
jgi:hypothetical protein